MPQKKAKLTNQQRRERREALRLEEKRLEEEIRQKLLEGKAMLERINKEQVALNKRMQNLLPELVALESSESLSELSFSLSLTNKKT